MRIKGYESWTAGEGRLTIQDAGGNVHIAFSERPVGKCRSTIALAVDPSAFVAWTTHLTEVLGRSPCSEIITSPWSPYFREPDGNPYEMWNKAAKQGLARK